MKIAGKMGSQFITILWDSGSTHSFMDAKTAKKLGCVGEYTAPLVVTIADGSMMECVVTGLRFCWGMFCPNLIEVNFKYKFK